MDYGCGAKTGGLSLRSERTAPRPPYGSRTYRRIAIVVEPMTNHAHKKSASKGAFFMVADEHLISTLRFSTATICR